jgi:dephospho-CoA kinase
MLRVGLTGGLGSGKSTVAALFRRLGAPVMGADAVGREMMKPGHTVYNEIVRTFGPGVVQQDGTLDRRRLAELSFSDGRLEELNAIVHPAVIAEQQRWMDQLAHEQPNSVAIYETALLFEASRASRTSAWRDRFDHLILVTAPEPVRIARYVARMAGPDATPETRTALAEEARRRIAAQLPDSEKIPLSDTILHNDGSVEEISRQTEELYRKLQALAAGSTAAVSAARRDRP